MGKKIVKYLLYIWWQCLELLALASWPCLTFKTTDLDDVTCLDLDPENHWPWTDPSWWRPVVYVAWSRVQWSTWRCSSYPRQSGHRSAGFGCYGRPWGTPQTGCGSTSSYPEMLLDQSATNRLNYGDLPLGLCRPQVLSYPGYLWKPYWLSMGIQEISTVTSTAMPVLIQYNDTILSV